MIGVKGLAERAEFGTVDIMVTLCFGIDSVSEGRVVYCASFKEVDICQAVVTIFVYAPGMAVCKSKEELSTSMLSWY